MHLARFPELKQLFDHTLCAAQLQDRSPRLLWAVERLYNHVLKAHILDVLQTVPDSLCVHLWLALKTAHGPFLCDIPQQTQLCLCRPDCILVLDTWFMLVVHYGKTIVEWRKAGYHLQPDQDVFR